MFFIEEMNYDQADCSFIAAHFIKSSAFDVVRRLKERGRREKSTARLGRILKLRGSIARQDKGAENPERFVSRDDRFYGITRRCLYAKAWLPYGA